jgi:hypothetical protein
VNFQQKVSEKEFQRQVIDIAQWHQWAVDHTPPMRSAKGAVFTGGLIGKADLVLYSMLGKGIIYAELKSQTGRIMPSQQMFRDLVTKNGAEYYLWRPSDMHEILERLSR